MTLRQRLYTLKYSSSNNGDDFVVWKIAWQPAIMHMMIDCVVFTHNCNLMKPLS